MEKSYQENTCEEAKVLWRKNGKVYFSRNMERKLLFVLTLIMFLLGALIKLGLF